MSPLKRLCLQKFLLTLVFISAFVFLSACVAPVAQQDATGGATEGEEVELAVYVQTYTPGVARATGLEPLTQFTEIANEYMELHPNVKITPYIAPSTSNPTEWLLPQLAGGTAPDITVLSNEIAYQYKDNNWFIDLIPYLEEPNPYIEGNTRWMDIFFESTTRAKIQANGALYGLPIDMVATGIVYNREIFDSLGLEEPQTWADFVEVQEAIKTAGYVPFAPTSPINTVDWGFVILFEGTALDVIQELDTLDPNGFTNHEEFCRGVANGWLDYNLPQQQEWLRLFADWSKNFQGDWTIEKDHLSLFLSGGAAMSWVTTRSVAQIMADPLREFEIGSFWLPPITSETSEYGTGEFIRGLGGAHATQLTITNTAIDGGKTDTAVDFLRFLSTPERAIPMIEEANALVPNIIGERSSDLLNGMMASIATDAGPGEQLVFLRFYDSEAGDLAHRVVHQVAGGSLSVEEAAVQLQELNEQACARLIQDNPEWDQSRW